MELSYVPREELDRLRETIGDRLARVAVFADALRLNTLYMIERAGSGHLGTSFSSMDIVAWLWLDAMKNPTARVAAPGEIYFSSKGHDAPGLYAALTALGKLPFEQIHKLRRLGGLDGHPDVKTPFMITNTGPLGMGISKARGLAEARRRLGVKGDIYVLLGDGELQEGQIWESLGPTANGKFSEITVIVDRNKIQSDSPVAKVSDLGDLAAKFTAFGWAVRAADGHDPASLNRALAELAAITDRPKVVIADTVKGKGISFLERLAPDGYYKYHAGALSAEEYPRALEEIVGRIQNRLTALKLPPLRLATESLEIKAATGAKQELVKAYADELVKLGRETPKLVALDADLVKSCGLVPFARELPEQFIECGIAEQDMVSAAAGLALAGFVPVVHSFSCFLSTRPNEQIYNAATEHPASGRGKVVYFGGQAGLLPAAPGHSHQEVRAIASLGAVPKLTLLEPANEREMRLAIRFAVLENSESTYLRVSSAKLEHVFELPEDYRLVLGRGVLVREGKDVLLTAYGPVLLNEAVKAAVLLEARGISAAVVNMPWLNRLDETWFAALTRNYRQIVTLDDHYVERGQGEFLAAALARAGASARIASLGLTEIPVCGTPAETLAYHRLDAAALAEDVAALYANV